VELSSSRRIACELMNKVSRILVIFAVLASALLVGDAKTLAASAAHVSDQAAQQPAAAEHAAPAPAGDHAQPAGEHAADEHAAEEHSVWAGLLWPTVNFVILVGALWWFFKEPFVNYLRERHSTIRKELVEAANVKAAAAAQLAAIDAKLRALPGEIEALRMRGSEEIAAEEQRISRMAAAERERLLEQTRREIDHQLRLAKRELVEHTANLAVQLASDRLQRHIATEDHDLLVDRYLDQVKKNPGETTH
jgi:F-type H+-transporting ATPase subunit b